MAKLYYEDTIIDIREKIYDTLTEIAQKGRLIDDLKKTGELNQSGPQHEGAYKIYMEYQHLMKKNKGKDFINEVIGTRDFFVLSHADYLSDKKNSTDLTHWELI
jgi:hypothetical protein